MMIKLKGLFIATVVSVVTITIITSIILLGSPIKQRMRKLDERRVDDLRQITSAINLYWTRQKTLPSSLTDLQKIDIQVKTQDPDSGHVYEYTKHTKKNYELCAFFNFDSADAQDPYSLKDFWSHGKGRHCYKLEAKAVRPD